MYIDGLGLVAESVWYNDDKTEGDFFYPFVEAGKTYTIRFVFLREEDYKDGFSLGHVGDGTIGWFQTDVTAGAGSKGEVRFTSKGTISVDKKYNFRFTQKPTFQNENLLTAGGNDWKEQIGLVEGISWEHGAERRTKWHGVAEIPSTKLTETCNLFEMCPWVPGIDFICIRPVMSYKHNNKTYNYQWDGFVQDIYYPPKADRLQTIDITNPSQASRIYGTWEYNANWTNDDYEIYDSVVPMKVKQTITLTIDAENCKDKVVEVLTKKDGSAFTEKEEEFHVKTYGDWRTTKISNDRKTVTQEFNYKNPNPLSEYFRDRSYDSGNYTEHYELKLFEDYELRVIRSGKNNGKDYEDCETYIKQ